VTIGSAGRLKLINHTSVQSLKISSWRDRKPATSANVGATVQAAPCCHQHYDASMRFEILGEISHDEAAGIGRKEFKIKQLL
jgi:hypothetical protein